MRFIFTHFAFLAISYSAIAVGNNQCVYRTDWQSPSLSQHIGQAGGTFFRQNNKLNAGWKLLGNISGSRASSGIHMDGIARLSIGLGPNNSAALKVLAPKGEVQAFHFKNQVYANGQGVTQVRASTEIYLPNDMQWGNDQKLGLGIWGGGSQCISGGCNVSNQDGFSVRVLNTSLRGVKGYSYELNRAGSYGRVSSPIMNGTGHIPKGRWVPLQLVVKLNSMGQTDGYVEVYVDGVRKIQMTGSVFRDSSHDWKIQGLFINDMWGGTEEDPIRHSPKNQVYWYRNYRVESCR